jgi:hypothetical protein
MHLRRGVMCRDPRVIAIAHERFEVITDDAIEMILQREGEEYGVQRARLLVQLLITIVDSVLDRSEPDLTRPLTDLITDAVRDARAVLAR